MFPLIIDSLAPIFLVIGLGWVLRQKKFLSHEALDSLARLAYWVAIPCLLFSKIIHSSPVSPAQISSLFFVTLGTTVSGMILSYLLAVSLKLPKSAIGTFVQAAFRGNLAFVGLPVIFYTFSGSDGSTATAGTAAILIFGPLVVFYNISAVVILLMSRHGISTQSIRPLLKEIASNPLFLSCLLGVLYAMTNLPLPTVAERTLDTLGQMALPLALICLGGSLRYIDLRDGWIPQIAAASAKVIMMPLLGYAIAWLVELNGDNTKIALILLACPTAAASYVLVHQLGGDEALASGAIVLSTPLAALALALVLTTT